MFQKAGFFRLISIATGLILAGCATTTPTVSQTTNAPVSETTIAEKYAKDRAAILSMAGNYRVTFDFIETVSFVEGYELKDRKLSGGDEIVRVIEDTGDFISLQHILVVGGDKKFPVKHWRQDWRYEPASVLVFTGNNSWKKRPVSAGASKGKWSQVVYQVDDAPRYGALGEWEHENGVSAWTPPSEWRPLPRRDATTRDDYQAVDAVNRHAIIPEGWVHEQDNSKLVLGDKPQVLVREVAVNTYKKFDDFDISIGDDYWAATEDFWKAVRGKWASVEATHVAFGLTIQGEPEELYMQILELADAVKNQEMALADAILEASDVIDEYVITK
ncbi:MAG: hypothetical protein DHS20C05_09900 [Hyphococcus sp.]|nr:MAG: hypothetical protein DHS20C05_09900 [Marinicaulis sp.]